MSEPKWTPGPWGVGVNIGFERGVVAGNRIILYANEDAFEDEQQMMATLFVAAASPDLYDVLRRLVEMFETIVPLNPDQIDYDAYKLAVEALRKARGESS